MLFSPVVHRVSLVSKWSLQVFRAVNTGSCKSQVTSVTSQQHAQLPRPVEEIPGPKHYPLIGCLPTMMKQLDVKKLHKFWIGMYDRYGPIYRLEVPGAPPTVFVVDADECQKINQLTQADPHRPKFDSMELVRKKYADHFFEGKAGILLENGEEWWRVRSKVQTPVMRLQTVSRYAQKMDQVTLDFLDRIATMQADLGEMPETFHIELYKWALESIGLVALNRRLGCLDPDLSSDSEQVHIIKLATTIFTASAKLEFDIKWWKILPFPTPTLKELQRCQEEFIAILLPTILDVEARLKKDPVPRDIMPLLETLLLTPGLSHKDVITFMLDLFLGGIDTTSNAVAFALYLLARNPEAQQRLQKEVDEVMGREKSPITQQHLAKFRYLKAVFKETLRVLPVGPGFARMLKEDAVICGYKVPAGYCVITLAMITGWQESYFPRAKEFLPERWLRDRPLGSIHPCASLPFSIGTRMCVGRRIAEQEMYILLARIAQRYTVTYDYEDIGIETHAIFRPSKPLKFSFTERG